ncbi:hypothetical protein EBN03_07090 [Nocardia stercoris]|uniref:DUF8020 domain-containing protein n=2 Tax=Nocardia stercoris TaxID=2483361 RepID=A0A3M2L9C6_9NOCA|nr:hypothetical protein EBN03_07090 [Nocardia stercoris]
MANGQAADFTMQNSAGPVAYTTTLAADHHSATVDLSSGHFALASDGTINVLADDGTNVGNIPTNYSTQAGQDFSITPVLSHDNTELTITPSGGPMTSQTALDTQANPLMHDALLIGALVGASVGCLVGIAIGIWFFLVGAVVGCGVGAVIGGTIGLFFPI